MKAVIEKELCNPVNGQVVGPLYHVYKVDDGGERTLIKTIDGDIKEAARVAERTIDWNILEVQYQKNPDSFKSTIC